MAWHSNTNQSPATYALCIWQLEQVMIAAGWTKIADSDGTTYSSSGTQLTGGGTGANGLNNSRAWMVLKAPAGNRQICFQRGTVGDYSWRITYSPVVGFTGGSPAATVCPYATDEIIACGGGTEASPAFVAWMITAPEGSCRYSARANDASPYCFWAQGWPIGGGTPLGGIWYDGVINGPTAADTDPHILNVDSSQGGWATGGAVSSNYTVAMQPSLNTMHSTGGIAFTFTAPSSGCAADPVTGKDILRPCEFFVSGGYYKGQTANVLWEMCGTSGSPRPLGYTLSVVTSSDYIVIGVLALPWDGSTPLI